MYVFKHVAKIITFMFTIRRAKTIPFQIKKGTFSTVHTLILRLVSVLFDLKCTVQLTV